MCCFIIFGFIFSLIIILRLVILRSHGDICPDCGFFVACDACSEKMRKIDEELDKKKE